jgi:long-subunit acyl-CoA synthetase (AMP-forming)
MPETVFEVFDATARAHADRPAMSRKRAGSWEHTSWREYHDAVGRAARALVALGVEPGAGVVILAANRPEWFVTSLATAMVGARTVGIYTNSTPEQVRFIADHAEATLALVDSKAALAKLEGAGGRPSRLKTVVLLEESPAGQGVLSWADFLAKGEEAHAAEVARRRQALTGATVSTLIYTSGTTGAPKAVMLTQRNLAFIAHKIQELVPVGGAAGDRLISYLPLSHIAEQVVSHLLSIATGAHVYFAESLEKLGDNLREVRPHFFLGVPRVWEKIQAGIQAAGATASPQSEAFSALVALGYKPADIIVLAPSLRNPHTPVMKLANIATSHLPIKGPSQRRSKKPITTEGTAAISSTIGLIIFLKPGVVK